jgi:hypothetical protein
VPITPDTLFIAHRFVNSLPQRYANILDRVMPVNVKIAIGINVKVNQSMTGNLIEHVIKKTDARMQA